MTLAHIDEKLCLRDGWCAEVCPAKLFEIQDRESVPKLIPQAEEYCIACGHCVAVCPRGALTHQAMGPEDCLPLKKELEITPEQVLQFLRSRRSIRAYQGQTVPRETLYALIELARYAPSGSNSQPVEWLVIHDTAVVRRLAVHTLDWMHELIARDDPFAIWMNLPRIVKAWEAGVDRITRGAPHLIIVHAPKDSRPGPTACTIALAYLDLAAASFGLGTCWAGYINGAALFHPPMTLALDLPDGHVCMGAMMVGYPRVKYARAPVRNLPKITWR